MDLRSFAAVGIALIVGAPVLAQDVVEIPGGNRSLTPQLTEQYRVGSLAGAEWETFANVRSVEFDAEGNLYILDADNHRVVVVDGSGSFLRQFGKEGDGPGELRNPSGMVVAPDGSVAVMDFGHQAFVLYDSEGGYIRNVRNEFQNGLMTSQIDYHPRNGAVGANTSVMVGPEGPMGSGPSIRMVLFAEGASIEDLAPVWRPEPEDSDAGAGGSFSTGGGGAVSFSGGPRQMAFTPNVRTGVLPDGRVVVADTAAYQFRLVDEDGVDELLRRPSVRPRPVGERERRAERERRLAEMEEEAASGGGGAAMMVIGGTRGGGGGSRSMTIPAEQLREMRMQRLEGMGYYDEIPTIESFAVDGEGRIWVERTGEPFGEDGPVDVVTADGGYLGTVPAGEFELPIAFGPGGLAAWVERDEFDVQYVVVRQVSGVR